MSTPLSTTPYFIRAIYEWCNDAGETPHIAVAVSSQTIVPVQYVRDGEIVLNIGARAVQRLQIDNHAITFSARFNGVAQELYVPIHRVRAIYSRESDTGMMFEISDNPEFEGASQEIAENSEKSEKSTSKPGLKLVK